MTDASTNNKRIAKNTLMLYFRMLLLMAVNFYTSRVVLNVLGVEDFGIYNVVGGVVTMFGFLNGALAACTQRYLNYELGQKHYGRIQRVFVTALYIHALISLLLIILAETVGLWFLYSKMTIPNSRLNAAFWVYQFSVLSTVVMMMSVPYNAAIIAHEKMSAFAYISILEAVLKLLIVFILQEGHYDKLIIYAILMFAVQMAIRIIYGWYCNLHFSETKFRVVWDKDLFRSMLSFSVWNVFGNLASVASTQGVNILLNMFFTPAVNAARGIAVQVQHAVMQFSANFQMAMNPQITKSFAMSNLTYMYDLIYKSSKFTFFLLYILSLPIILETDTILNVWLTIVPEYATPFIRLMLCTSIINAVANPLMTSAAATGKIKIYQVVVGGMMLAVLPLSYIVLRMGGNPVSVFVVNLLVYAIAFIVRLLIVCSLIQLSILAYIKDVILKCTFVCLLALIIPLFLKHLMIEGLVAFLVVCIASIISVAVSSYFLGLTASERIFFNNKISSLFTRLKR
ncbi:MAG: oligosaccharide flippase family protein [Prevotella sp.]|nr:oligosaccharide flippase family protein [Prevotella sp.]